MPFDDSLALLGTRFGQLGTPTWVLDLELEPPTILRQPERRSTIRQVIGAPERSMHELEVSSAMGGTLKDFVRHEAVFISRV